MSNFKLFGSPIHDTAIVFIASSAIFSVMFYTGDNYLNRTEANLTLLLSAAVSFAYWFKEYRIKK